MAAETGFMIDGVSYEMPSLDSFTMDDAQVLYDYSGLTVEDFLPPEDAELDEQGGYELDEEQRNKMKNPGFLRALMHIAYQRGNPRMSAARVKSQIGAANLVESLQHLATQEAEDDAGPPALTTEPSGSSPSGSVESNENSGDASRTSSDGQVVPLERTTTTESDTSSISLPMSSVS